MPTRPRTVRPPPPIANRPKNKLLASLPRAEFQRLQPHLRTVPTTVKQVLHPANVPIRDIYFPNDGVASVTAMMNDGAMVEIATVGAEGFIGAGAVFGAAMTTGEAMMQVPGTSAEILPVEIFKRELDRHGPFFDAVQRYMQGFMALMMQSTACMALHSVQERCCRWLLMTHDRVGRDDFHLSHEFLAMMLGSTRPTVTVVAGTLQRAGLIKYRHGRITIVDRESLESAACECYATVKAHFNRLGL